MCTIARILAMLATLPEFSAMLENVNQYHSHVIHYMVFA